MPRMPPKAALTALALVVLAQCVMASTAAPSSAPTAPPSGGGGGSERAFTELPTWQQALIIVGLVLVVVILIIIIWVVRNPLLPPASPTEGSVPALPMVNMRPASTESDGPAPEVTSFEFPRGPSVVSMSRPSAPPAD
jgi:hypothetical protein